MKRSSTLAATVIVGLLMTLAVAPGASAVSLVSTIDAGIGEDPQPIAISSDGSTAVVGSDGSVQIIDTTSNTVITSVPNGYFFGYGAGFSEWEAVPGTTWFAGVHGGIGISLIDAATATADPSTLSIWGLVPPYGIDGTNIASLAVSADGQTLWALVADASNDDAYDIAVWDLRSSDLLDHWSVTSWTSIDDAPPQLSVSPDGGTGYALFPGAFDDSDMLVFDMSAQSVTTRVSIDDDVTSMAMSPDGQQIFVTSSWNDTVLAYGPGGTEGYTIASIHDRIRSHSRRTRTLPT